ncbi:MAG: hypothetical protein A2Y25_04340 [Candidatus Melainabacteria bacterium GWF2_37_15]|nr:MAG: hypothetical protein A2Y25_04340 [Candidatus Melainabacteria bacterium GWF2_37_15]
MGEFYSIVIPVYNTSESLRELTARIKNVFSSVIKKDFEIIFVDDASLNPDTWKTLNELTSSEPNVISIRLTQNFGQQAATLCGINIARGNLIITMDDDLQHQPEDIPLLLKEQHHDIVIACFKKKKHSLFKVITSNIKGWFDEKLIKKPKHIRLSSFRLINNVVAQGILQIKTVNPFIPALMFNISRDVVNVEATHQKRKEGKTGYSLIKMMMVFSNLIINNSSLLLKISGLIGIFISLISFCFAIFIIVKKLFFGIPIVGWASVMVSSLFIGGTILFSMGIIGEYLVRIIKNIENRPTYFIRTKIGGNINEKPPVY